MIDMNDVQQILDDDKAANWELREVIKDLVDELNKVKDSLRKCEVINFYTRAIRQFKIVD